MAGLRAQAKPPCQGQLEQWEGAPIRLDNRVDARHAEIVDFPASPGVAQAKTKVAGCNECKGCKG